MFPFLAPISFDLRSYRIVDGRREVEVQHWLTLPVVEELQGSRSSGSLKGSESLTPSPPPSRASGSGTPRSRHDSSRSTPLPVPDVPFNVSKMRQKGLETSSAMKELFGGGPDYSAWEKKQQEKTTEPIEEVTTGTRRFGRKNIFEKERIQTFSDLPLNQPSSIFSEISDHDRIYEKCHKKVRKRTPSPEDNCRPGPERFEEDEGDTTVETTVDSPVLADQPPQSSRQSSSSHEDTVALDQPGPDIDDEEERRGRREEEGESGESESREGVRDAEEEGGGESGGSGVDEGMSVLVKGAQVVNDDSIFIADVLVVNGIITQVGPSLEVPQGIRVIDGEGKIVMPAGIDVHTHFTAPLSADDMARGSKAALAGGTATVVETVWPREGEGLLEAVKRVKKNAESEACCNVAVSGVINKWDDNTKSQVERAVKDENVNSFIVDVEEDDVLYQILSTCRSLGVHVRVLPERKCIVRLLESRMLELGITGPEGFLQSRPSELEAEKVSSLSVLSSLTNCPVSVLQLSSSDSCRALQEGRVTSPLLHAEVATVALATDGTHYFNKCAAHAASHMTDCPLRAEATSAQALLHVLANVPLSVVSSGHRAIPSSARAKKDFTKMPKGVAAAEERMAVLWEKAVRSGRVDAMRFVALTSSNAAKIFNLYPKKGRIAVGADGDLVLWDVSGSKRALGKGGQSAADTSPFEGMNVHSRAIVTIVGGRVAWAEGTVKEGKGKVVDTRSHSPYLFGVVQQREKNPVEKVDRGESTNSHSTENGASHIKEIKTKNKNLESSITFGDSSNAPRSRARNPPGGKTSGLW